MSKVHAELIQEIGKILGCGLGQQVPDHARNIMAELRLLRGFKEDEERLRKAMCAALGTGVVWNAHGLVNKVSDLVMELERLEGIEAELAELKKDKDHQKRKKLNDSRERRGELAFEILDGEPDQ